MTTQFFETDPQFLQKHLILLNRVLNSEYLLQGTFFGNTAIHENKIFQSTAKLQKTLLEQFAMLHTPKKLPQISDIKAEFDLKVFKANLEKIERKMTKLNEDYTICVNRAHDELYDQGIKNVERSQEFRERTEECNDGAAKLIDNLDNWLAQEGKNRLFCWVDSSPKN